MVVLVQAISRMFFLRRSGRIGQKVLLELRRRVFRHFQRLDIAFHDRYTSGRVVSRSTNDVEAIQDMLETGFDSLITAVLTLVGTAMLLVDAGRAARPDVSGRLPGSGGAGVVVPHRVGQDVPQGAGERRAGDRAVRRDDDRHQGGAGLPARAAQPGDLRRHRRPVQREINEKTFRLLAIFMPGVKLVGNITTGVVLLYGGYRVLHGEMTIGTLTAFLLYLRMFFEPMQEISQFFNTFQSASSALEKLAGVLAEQPGISDPQQPGHAREGARRHRVPRRAVLVRAGPAGAAGPGLRGARPGRPSRWSAPPARARPRSPS